MYDYTLRKSRVEFGPNLVMLGPGLICVMIDDA